MVCPSESELLQGSSLALEGSTFSAVEAVELVTRRFPHKPYCLVEQWTIFRANLTPDELERVYAATHLPLFLFAHKVLEDSRGRFQPGDWVRSRMSVTFEDNVMFETKKSVYVLIGPGHEQTASLKTIFSFF